MVKHTSKILRCPNRNSFKVRLATFQDDILFFKNPIESLFFAVM